MLQTLHKSPRFFLRTFIALPLSCALFLQGCRSLNEHVAAHASTLAAAPAVHMPPRPLPKFLQAPPRFPAFNGSLQECDVLVVGGTPSGVAAALAASRRGARVVLIEERPHLGGDIVYQMLNMWDVPLRPH